MIQKVKQQRILLILLILSIIYIVIDIFVNDKLFKDNRQFVDKLQNKYWQNDSYKSTMKFFTLLGYGIPFIICIVLEFLFRSNQLALFVRINYVLFSVYSLATLKQIYHQYRPYMYYYEMKQYGCDQEYGNPSGHALSFTTLTLVFMIDYLIDMQTNKYSFAFNYLFIFLYFSIAFVMIFMVGFSRIFLGVHSYNQVLLGNFYAFFFVLVYFLGLKYKMQQFMVWSLSTFKRYRFYLIWCITLVSFLIISIVSYESRKSNENSQLNYDIQQWLNLNMKIKGCAIDPNKFLYSKCFTDSGYIFFLFGSYLGCLIHPEQSYQNEQPLRKPSDYQKTLFFKVIVKILVFFGLSALIIFLFNLINHPTVYVKFFVVNGLAIFFVGLIYTYLTNFILKCLNLDTPGDFPRLRKFNHLKIEQEKNQRVLDSQLKAQLIIAGKYKGPV